ncbi:DUF6318 family protein [Sanguibacter suaedae]|uniref:DUF6318 domain-containing protein n=1 Tax=Sanguibacter suaedae TaxID=2795737 RepID=A0A934MAY2_9MICO|nr:DUF6318 family protein [Sanguibacter suaedae]MBI9114716.1 hypothetical protein [Sanguibacter suaedae]
MSVHRRTTRTTRRPAGWALLTAAVLVLTGCTDDPAPTPSDAATTSTEAAPTTPEPTETPAPQPPERPAAMNGIDEEAAKAAAGYFLELYTYTLQSGDLTAWSEASGPSCNFCTKVTEDVAEEQRRGERTTGGVIAWNEEPAVTRVEGTRAYEVQFDADQAEGYVLDPGGQIIQTFSPGPLEIHAFVYKEEEWVLYDMSSGS